MRSAENYWLLTTVGVADTWKIMGLQANYWSNAKDGSFVQFLQIPDDNQFFFPDSYKANVTFDEDYFALPSYCSGKCPLFSICTIAQDKQPWP